MIKQNTKIAEAGRGIKFNVLGHEITTVFTKNETEGNYYVFEVITPPGLGIPPHVHEVEDEFIHVLEGDFEIMLDDDISVASSGDTLFFPKGIAHSFQNIGDKSGKTLWTIIPGGNFESFFEKISKLPAGDPDMQLVDNIFAEYGMTILKNMDV